VIVGSGLVRYLSQSSAKPRDEFLREIEAYVGGLSAAVASRGPLR